MTAIAATKDWQGFSLRRVGNLSAVMEKKSGPHFDPSPVHINKRGNGPPPKS